MGPNIPERLNLTDYYLDARVQEGKADRVALRIDRANGRTREMSYRDVQELANQFGRLLEKQGVEPEQRVIVALIDSAEFAGALFGALKIGAVVVMVNPKLPAADLAAIFEYARPKAAVVEGESLAAFEEAAASAGWPKKLVTVRSFSEKHASFEEEGGRLRADLPAAPTHRDDPAIWLFSGGTTGRPKAVVQSHGSFFNTTELYAKAALGYREDDVTMSVPRLFFGYATGSNLFFPFSVGASAVLFAEHPTAEVVFEMIRRHRPTILINVPTMVNHMVQHAEAAAQDLSCLRFATSAGEALPVPLYHRWKETFGVELLDGLGTAEMWHIFLSNLPGAVKPGTLGRVIPGFELRVVGDDGSDVADGEVGRMWVRGASRALWYWQEMERSMEAFRGEWFVGGDLVSRDAEGFVTYHGRGDDVLKVGGKWLVPGEVEACLLRHAAVRECAVVGATDAAGLIKPRAFVIADDPSPELAEELKAFVLAELAAYKHPREIVFVDALPRTHLGKVDRGKLRREAATAG